MASRAAVNDLVESHLKPQRTHNGSGRAGPGPAGGGMTRRAMGSKFGWCLVGASVCRRNVLQQERGIVGILEKMGKWDPGEVGSRRSAKPLRHTKVPFSRTLKTGVFPCRENSQSGGIISVCEPLMQLNKAKFTALCPRGMIDGGGALRARADADVH